MRTTKSKQPKQPTLRKVQLKDLKPGPVRHTTLPLALMPRVQHIHKVLGEFFCPTIEGWLEGFLRDTHPEKEVAVWESIAYAFTAYTEGKNLSQEACKEVFGFLLGNTVRNGDVETDAASLKYISVKNAVELYREQLKTWAAVKEEMHISDNSCAQETVGQGN